MAANLDLEPVFDLNLYLGKAVAPVVDKLTGWAVATVKMLPNLVVGIAIVIIFWVLSAYAARLANRLVFRFTGYRHIARLLARMTTLAVIGLGFILALDALNLDKAVASMLAGIGILGVALGFAGKDLFADFIAGIVLHFEHPFRLDDLVKSGDMRGYVDTIKWRATIIRGRLGERITIPNKDLLGKPLINYYFSGLRRIDLYAGIDYASDLQQAEDLALEAVRALEPPLRDPDRPVEFFYEEFSESSITFRLRFWIERPDQPVFLRARSEAIKAIRRAFSHHGITIPFPIRTLDFGVTGGQILREQLEGLNIVLSTPEEKNKPETKQ
ncbi:MAG: mechanosensitive ion channel family protein [Syntrophobacterales bacterium]|nr:mechanosensitive ion channel family protein [Syntrophobacterales bacterium]